VIINSSMPTVRRGPSKPSIRVAAFTGSKVISSPRFRVRQYIPHLEDQGIHVTEYVARYGSWPPDTKAWRPLWFPATVLDRVPGVVQSYQYDVTLLQREMVSTLVTLERFTHRPRILDVDDAVWLSPRSRRNFATLAKICDSVICGNDFIVENVRQWNQNTFVLPTAVDTDRFRPLESSARRRTRPVIGWSGLRSNLRYLIDLERALAAVLDSHKDAVLRVVCDVKPVFRLLDSTRVEYIPWSLQNEVQTIQEMSIGLMPIEDTLWGRGKCSYKMLLYMSCGLPVAVSPVGMNNEVLARGTVGFGPASDLEWADCLKWLLDNPERAREMGAIGREVVERYYSLHLLAPRLAGYLKMFSR
jgi:glycosyltransferase involved in cell wall biosynthesis